MRHFVFSLAVSVALTLPCAGRGDDHAAHTKPASAAPEPDGSVHPSDSPLHKAGVDPMGMRPFAETEKWIEYLDKPERAAWQKPDEVLKALALEGTETGAGSSS